MSIVKILHGYGALPELIERSGRFASLEEAWRKAVSYDFVWIAVYIGGWTKAVSLSKLVEFANFCVADAAYSAHAAAQESRYSLCAKVASRHAQRAARSAEFCAVCAAGGDLSSTIRHAFEASEEAERATPSDRYVDAVSEDHGWSKARQAFWLRLNVPSPSFT